MQYNVTITTLTQLHIGTGNNLLMDYDLKKSTKRNLTYRLNIDAIFEDALQSEGFDDMLRTRPPAELVSEADLERHPEFVSYTLPGKPQSYRVSEQLKDVWGKLYLPGSTLKGALRSALGRAIPLMDESIRAKLKVKMEGRRRGPSPKQADDIMEAAIFGPQQNRKRSWANYDLLRALQVADSRPIDPNLMLINVGLIQGKKNKAPIDLEAIPQETTFKTTIRTDEYLYNETKRLRERGREWVKPADYLEWADSQTQWLDNLPEAAFITTSEQLDNEINYYKAAGLAQLERYVQALRRDVQSLRGSNEFLLQLGWGPGWNNKTFGQPLIAPDDNEFTKIRNTFKLGKPPHSRKWQAYPEDIFPKTRRLVVTKRGKPVSLLGWVYVKLERVK